MGFRNTPPPLWLLRIWVPLYQFGLGVRARLPGGRYSRFLILPDWCKRAVDRGASVRATVLAHELLALAGSYPDDSGSVVSISHYRTVCKKPMTYNSRLEKDLRTGS
jgi:hypothetical protein